MHQLQ